MSATVRYAQVQNHPGFRAVVDGEGHWVLQFPDGTTHDVGQDFEIVSPYGTIQSAMVVKPDGTPAWSHPIFAETASVNIVAWGRRNADDPVRIAIIRQPRPFPDDPERPGNAHQPVVFGQTPMGYIDQEEGGAAAMYSIEAGQAAAAREAEEETGATVALQVTNPRYPYLCGTVYHRTWTQLHFVQVDLAQIEALKDSHLGEPIFSAEYITVKELFKRIREGQDEKGAVYRLGIALADLMVFFACHPEFLPRTTKKRRRGRRGTRKPSRK